MKHIQQLCTLRLNRQLWRLVLLTLLCVIAYLALSPAPPRQADLGWDKLNHWAAFAALSFSACMGFTRTRRNAVLHLFFLLAYGGAIELAQTQIAGRSGEWADLLADTIGIIAGLLAATLVSRIFRP
jgi:VanZ family protein